MSSLGDSVQQLDPRCAERCTGDPGAARESVAGVAGDWREALCILVGGARRSARPRSRACSRRSVTSRRRRLASSPASAAAFYCSSRPSSSPASSWPSAGGQPCQPCHFRTPGRPSTGRRVRHAGHGDHPGRCTRRHRRRVHSGDHRRPVPVGRRRALGRRPGDDRSGARHRPDTRADRDVAGDRLHLVARGLREGSRRSSTRC